jgi:hypothetical protein
MAEILDNPPNVAAQADQAEQDMFVRHALGMLGYSALPSDGIKGALMAVGPVGDLATMAGIDFLARALTPRGANEPPAGYTIVDGKVRVAAEVFDERMRKDMVRDAKGMAGEAVATGGASLLGLTGPVGAGVGLLGNLAARSGIRALTPPNWLVRMATIPGTNRPPLNMAALTREMVTFTRAKFGGDNVLIFSGHDIERVANSPGADPSDLTVKFDQIWAREKTMRDPSQGALHRIVKALVDYTDKQPNPMNALNYDLSKTDPQNPFYIPPSGEPSAAWQAAADGLLGMCGIPDRKTKNTNLLMKIDISAVSNIDEETLAKAKVDGAEATKQAYADYDWDRMPPGKYVTLGVRYNPQGLRTETFSTRILDGEICYIGEKGEAYSAADFARQVVEPRKSYLFTVDVKDDNSPFLDADKPSARNAAIVGASRQIDHSKSGTGQVDFATPSSNPQGGKIVAPTVKDVNLPDSIFADMPVVGPAFTI